MTGGGSRGRNSRRARDGAHCEYVFDLPLDEVASRAIRGFDAYWRSKMTGDQLPSRADIDPAEITVLLPDLVLLNVEWDPFRCSVRLRGTRAEQLRPKDPTTRYLDEGTTFAPGRREDYIAEMKLVATERRPAFAHDYLITRAGLARDIWAGIWPLARQGEPVNMLVVIEDFAGIDAKDFDLR
ncbi:MAG TPA: PAS domain-containing protein [Alphaproteobacteria bacterium]|nr:PAS domain-containing protein [Alphaproteobacteria bacterium]